MIAAMIALSLRAVIVPMLIVATSLLMHHVATSHPTAIVIAVLHHAVTSQLSLLVVTAPLLHHAATSLPMVIVIAVSHHAVTSLRTHHAATDLLHAVTIRLRVIAAASRAHLTNTVLTAHRQIVLPMQANQPVQAVNLLHVLRQRLVARPSLHVATRLPAQAHHVQVHHARQQAHVVASPLTAVVVN